MTAVSASPPDDPIIHVADAAAVTAWTTDELRAELARLGLLPVLAPATIEALSGGVSNDVVAVHADTVNLVVKRALPRLRVEEEWLAAPGRIMTEAAALQLAGVLEPTLVPAVLAVDPTRHVMAISRAPDSYADWRIPLLDGVIDLHIAERLGAALASWQVGTRDRPGAWPELSSTATFDQLRIDPFYRWVARRHPDRGEVILAAAADLLVSPRCLVHGDFSPKNVLTDGDGLWVIDWEAAHLGDPVFDVAFLVSHLICKALHRPQTYDQYHAASSRFVAAYQRDAAPALGPMNEQAVSTHIACLVLARVDGKSPAPYLQEPARVRGRAFARSALAAGVATVEELWQRLTS